MRNLKAIEKIIYKIDEDKPHTLEEIESFIVREYNIEQMEQTLKSYDLVDKFLRQLANMDFLDNADGIVQITAKALLEIIKK